MNELKNEGVNELGSEGMKVYELWMQSIVLRI